MSNFITMTNFLTLATLLLVFVNLHLVSFSESAIAQYLLDNPTWVKYFSDKNLYVLSFDGSSFALSAFKAFCKPNLCP